MARWLNNNIILISLSAFFSDLGYQSVLASLPVFMVLVLHAPVYIFGITVAISYGLGSVLGYLGGRLSDRYGRRRISIIGNALIPLLSLTGLSSGFYEAAALFSSGWLARNFRTPARRALLSDEITPKSRGRVFGFLNALDVGGGALSIILLILLTYLKVELRYIILITIIPISFATILLLFVKERRRVHHKRERTLKAEPYRNNRSNNGAYIGVIIATSLFGFSLYSLGFPILTIAQSTSSNALGFGSYLIFLIASALFGFYIGSRRLRIINTLGILGYILSAAGTLLLALSYLYGLGAVAMYISILIIGMAVGTIDTLEPALITQLVPRSRVGKGMGSITAARGLGLFVGNIIMGVLYYYSPFYSYSYATIVALAGGAILLISGSAFKGNI